MPAGHVIVVVVVGLVVASFLNADSLKRTAETQLEQDSFRQDVALAFAKPLDAVSGFFRITWPRDRLDQALGKRQGAGFEEASPEDLPDPTVVSGPVLDGPSTTLPPAEMVTPDDPLRVWIGGDSLAGEYGIALSRRLNDTGLAETNRAGDVQVSSGLSRPDVFNWPAQAEAAGDLFEADVIVFVFGLNDDQAVELPGGGSAQFGTEEWIAEYRRRVGGMMDQQVGNDRTVVWVGIPRSVTAVIPATSATTSSTRSSRRRRPCDPTSSTSTRGTSSPTRRATTPTSSVTVQAVRCGAAPPTGSTSSPAVPASSPTRP
ncbi:MAG: hypothetical protein M5U31_06515 [Acidimicrobiia bacterium]|nr:hypothetical protein [Acidimicrobiia bacterium]